MNARTPTAVLDLASEQETASRRARMAAAALARQARVRDRSEAMHLIRKHGVRSPEELLSLMQCIHAAIEKPTMDARLRIAGDVLIDLCLDLDAELNAIEPELAAFGGPRGEYDSATVGVRNRSEAA